MPDKGAALGNEHATLTGAVLFACTMNAVRSVIAAGIFRHLAGPGPRVGSVGVHAGAFDPLVCEVMDEIGIDVGGHRPKSFDELHGEEYDLIVTLSPEAHHKALRFALETGTRVEYWPTMDATTALGLSEDEQLLRGYRQVRDQLFQRIKGRFLLKGGPTV